MAPNIDVPGLQPGKPELVGWWLMPAGSRMGQGVLRPDFYSNSIVRPWNNREIVC